jgi:hypothetical protein
MGRFAIKWRNDVPVACQSIVASKLPPTGTAANPDFSVNPVENLNLA